MGVEWRKQAWRGEAEAQCGHNPTGLPELLRPSRAVPAEATRPGFLPQPPQPPLSPCSLYSRGWKTFFVKGHTVNIFIFEGCVMSTANTQAGHCSTKAAINNIKTNECGCVPTNLYLQRQQAAGFGPATLVPKPLLFLRAITSCCPRNRPTPHLP